MIVIDANLLLYAFNGEDEQHAPARQWLESMLAGPATVAIPMLAISALLRVATNHRLTNLPVRMEDAVRAMDELTALPNVRVLHTGPGHWEVLKRVLDESGVYGRTVTDAQFAALTIQHGGTLYTTDRHFARFSGLRWKNPLAAERGKT